MSTKVFVGAIMIVLAVGTYVLYSRLNNANEEDYASESGILFNCADGNSFVAEFSPNFEKVNIVVKGEVLRTLNKASGSIMLYTNNSYTYTFAGEEVTVNNVGTGSRTSCEQPFYISRAPYNFSDIGEGGGETVDLIPVVEQDIIGTWKSVDDPNFTREFKIGGKAIDVYMNGEDNTGVWEVFTKKSGRETSFPLEDNVAYIKMTFGDDNSEVLHFKLAKLTPEELELVYMERGGVLRFSVIK